MKRKMPLLFVLGIGLILSSLCIMLIFGIRMYAGNQHSRKIVSQMNDILPQRKQGIPGTQFVSQMPALALDGADYVAMLEIPAFGVTVPVTDKWDSRNLYSAPCRFAGSAYDNTLVIGGTDSSQQFAFCDKIDNGASVILTDMTGVMFSYTVSRVDRAKHAETQWLMEADCDLTLFCKDVYSMEYIAVRCILSYGG